MNEGGTISGKIRPVMTTASSRAGAVGNLAYLLGVHQLPDIYPYMSL